MKADEQEVSVVSSKEHGDGKHVLTVYLLKNGIQRTHFDHALPGRTASENNSFAYRNNGESIAVTVGWIGGSRIWARRADGVNSNALTACIFLPR